jgi:hypothetical protein
MGVFDVLVKLPGGFLPFNCTELTLEPVGNETEDVTVSGIHGDRKYETRRKSDVCSVFSFHFL